MKSKQDIIDELETESDGWQTTYLQSEVEKAMDEWAKEVAIDYENWKKSMGIKWCVDNAHTHAKELFELYLKEKEKVAN